MGHPCITVSCRQAREVAEEAMVVRASFGPQDTGTEGIDLFTGAAREAIYRNAIARVEDSKLRYLSATARIIRAQPTSLSARNAHFVIVLRQTLFEGGQFMNTAEVRADVDLVRVPVGSGRRLQWRVTAYRGDFLEIP